jgi:hypothetical protein
VEDCWEVIEMKLLFGAILLFGSIVGMLVSFLSQIVVNSPVSVINGLEMSWALGIFFIMAGLSGIYMLLNHN